jgi:repressor LexA
MSSEVTKRQLEILKAIEDAILNDGRPPSIPQLMESFKVASPNGIAKHLIALEKKGYIARSGGARGIKVLGDLSDSKIVQLPTGEKRGSLLKDYKSEICYVPIVGTIAAGSPILAEENVEDSIPMPADLTGNGSDTFYLRVKGESMIEEGIFPGDLVMVGKCEKVDNGELAAVMVEDEATVKRFFQKGNVVTLEPANKDFEPIVIDLRYSTCKIVGRIIGLLRSYKRKL